MTALAGRPHHTPPTDDDLVQIINPAVCVDRALTAAERGGFMQLHEVGFSIGRQPADWIAEAQARGRNNTRMRQWWDTHAGNVVAYLMAQHRLPEPLTRAILDAALHATFAIATADMYGGRRNQTEIASAAALFARGYAEALGWTPDPVTGP